jgi:hypothetical protein
MFSNDLTLYDKSGDDVVYRLFRSDNVGTQRIDVATTLAAPALMSIKHSTAGKGSAAVDRHLVQFSRTILDGTTGLPYTLVCNFTLQVPRAAVITSQIVYDQVCNLADFLTDGAIASVAATTNIDALLRGEA